MKKNITNIKNIENPYTFTSFTEDIDQLTWVNKDLFVLKQWLSNKDGVDSPYVNKMDSGPLIEVTNGDNTGYRFKIGDESNFHGPIGIYAVDLSYQTEDALGGALGNYSFATGQNTKALGEYSTAIGKGTIASGECSTAIGKYNATTDALFVIGNGTFDSRSDAFTVDFSGNVTATSFVGDGSQLTGISGGSLETVTEGGNIGYRLKEADTNKHGDIGKNALDLSIQDTASSTKGATGENSIAMGKGTTASAKYSTAMGNTTTAIGENSTAMGESTTASDQTSTANGFWYNSFRSIFHRYGSTYNSFRSSFHRYGCNFNSFRCFFHRYG